MVESVSSITEEWVAGFSALESDAARRTFLESRPELLTASSVDALCVEINRLLLADLERAKKLAGAARWLARELGDERALALACRVAANVFHTAGENDSAQELYERALVGFERVGEEREAAITRSSALLNLAFLGEYDEVRVWEERARRVFVRLEDRLRLAVLEHNYANTLYRQDRWENALERYTAAYEEFRALGSTQNVVACLHNIAVCHISLHHFDDALAAYERNRVYCEENGLSRLTIYSDYNIAYLHYLRGEYTRAIRLYQEVRRRSKEEGDDYHRALSDLDQAELYLELNMVDEAAVLARQATDAFAELKMPYESAKALTSSAIALSRQGKAESALEQLLAAREIFVQEKNELWVPLIDFYRAVVLYRARRPAEAIRLAQGAREAFQRRALAPKAVMCELLLAELLLDLEELDEASATCHGALERLGELEAPVLEHQAYRVLGQVEEALGHRQAALEAYRQSCRRFERLRVELQGEDLRIAFLSDKHAVFESLVWLTMQDASIPDRQRATFEYIEQARSRSLADLMAFRAHDLPATRSAHRELATEVRHLREELNWYYRQIDLQQMRGSERALHEVEKIRRAARTKEDGLLSALRRLQSSDLELASLQTGDVSDLETVRRALPEGALLVEYFIARGTIFGCVVGEDLLEIVPVTTAARTQEVHRRLQFQLSRTTLGRERLGGAWDLVAEATQAHLEDLYKELIAPLRHRLEADHLVIVPHGFLHYVPFHALAEGGRHLIEEYSISYAPSASVFHLCAAKETAWKETSLVLGVADLRAPQIVEEARAVAEALPGSTLLLGEEATEEALNKRGATSRYVHLATHGLFRRDNPMFSAIQLGTTRLSLFDVYNLRLKAELVVLSGCGTGLNAVVGSDELVGLTRGFLYAGAQSVVVSLWDVNDASTALFMRRFYEHLGSGAGRATALRRTMIDLKESHPSPYYWAPFVLVGKPA